MLPAIVVTAGLAGVALALNPTLFVILACAIPGMVIVKRRLTVRLRARTRIWQQAFDQFTAQTQLALRTRTLAEARAAEEVEVERRRVQVEELSTAASRWRGVSMHSVSPRGRCGGERGAGARGGWSAVAQGQIERG